MLTAVYATVGPPSQSIQPFYREQNNQQTPSFNPKSIKKSQWAWLSPQWYFAHCPYWEFIFFPLFLPRWNQNVWPLKVYICSSLEFRWIVSPCSRLNFSWGHSLVADDDFAVLCFAENLEAFPQHVLGHAVRQVVDVEHLAVVLATGKPWQQWGQRTIQNTDSLIKGASALILPLSGHMVWTPKYLFNIKASPSSFFLQQYFFYWQFCEYAVCMWLHFSVLYLLRRGFNPLRFVWTGLRVLTKAKGKEERDRETDS